MTGIPMKVQFAGLKELQASLKELEPKLQRRVLRRVLRKQSKMVLATIKASMPSNPDGDEKSLAALLKARAGKGRRGYMSDGVAWPSREELGATGDPYYWPMALEYGHAFPGRGVFTGVTETSKKGDKKRTLRRRRKSNKDVAPRPYVRQAWDQKEAIAGASIEADTFRELEKMWASRK